MIVIIDNSPRGRGAAMLGKIQVLGFNCIHFKYITGDKELSGDWPDLRQDFRNIVLNNRVLFIHCNNPRWEQASEDFLNLNESNIVVSYSGGGNYMTYLSQKYSLNKFIPYQNPVDDNANSTWRMYEFLTSVGNGNLEVEWLLGYNPILETLSQPFQEPDIFQPNTDAKSELKAYISTIISKHGDI